MKKTVKEILEIVDDMNQAMGNVHVSVLTVWNSEQIKALIDRFDDQNRLIKVEITHGFEPGEKCYSVIVWQHPPILPPH